MCSHNKTPPSEITPIDPNTTSAVYLRKDKTNISITGNLLASFLFL